MQSAVADTTEVKYKPIASVDQSDLDLDIKHYIRDNLNKADVTALNNTDFTAVTNIFLHSLFSQCSIAPNGLTITQVAEL